MDFLIYFFGPLLAIGLPIALAICCAALGLFTQTFSNLFRSSGLIIAASSLVVPATAKFPAPWWLAAMFYPFEYSGRAFVTIAFICLGLFFSMAFVRTVFLAKFGGKRDEP